jgi:hypothetical protein
MVFKITPASSLTTICFVQKITYADGSRTIGGGYEELSAGVPDCLLHQLIKKILTCLQSEISCLNHQYPFIMDLL